MKEDTGTGGKEGEASLDQTEKLMVIIKGSCQRVITHS